MLVIRSFSKSYHEEQILSVDSLALSPGVHLFKGGNGSGKTTFFKCLSGISPSSGEISLGQVSLNKNPVAYRYDVNFSEAEPVFPGFLTARDLMSFVGKTKKASVHQLNYYRERLGINWFYEKSCNTCSSGMLKKISLALAFLGDPKMIILDEPTITLDEETRGSLYQLMKEKVETIFLVSSHQEIEMQFPEISSSYSIVQKKLVIE